MGVIGRAALTVGVLATAIAGGTAVASDAPPGGAAWTGRAVILVSTPDLPAGRSPDARWRELRSRSRGILSGVAERHDLRVETSIPEIGLLSVDLGPGGLLALRQRLAGEERVRKIRPDVPVELRLSPNDFAYNTADPRAPGGDLWQWNLLREGGPGAWDRSRGIGAEVAVIDTGTYGAHPDLAPRIVAAQAFDGSASALVDSSGHGTHSAGLACADSDNAYGIASLGFDCNLFIAKVELCSDLAAALTTAANRGSDVISMSIGGCPPEGVASALAYANGRGSVLVAAAENAVVPNPAEGACASIFVPDNCLYPAEWVQPSGTGPDAGFNRGLVVTSAKYDGARSGFAEATTRVSVAAYGSANNTIGGQQGILSTWPAGAVSGDNTQGGRTSVNGDNRFAYLVGTSMATPQVAGVAALMRAVNPNVPNATVVQLIKSTASHCGSYANEIGWGIVRADEAVVAALGQDIDPPGSHVRKAKRIKRRGASSSRSRGRPVKIRLMSADARQARCVKDLPISGVQKLIVFASRNGRTYRRIGKTTTNKLTFRPKRKGRYSFYSVAVDKAGNREAPPAAPDITRKLRRG